MPSSPPFPCIGIDISCAFAVRSLFKMILLFIVSNSFLLFPAATIPASFLLIPRKWFFSLLILCYYRRNTFYSPTFTSYSGGVYEMDLTRTAVNSFATHCSKLKPEITGTAHKNLERVLQHKPNYFMDTAKFIKRLATYVAVEHTAFIIPIEDEYGALCGWYPLRAQRCEVVEVSGQIYLRYLFANGEHGAIEFEKVGIMTDYEYTDDLFGEDNRTLQPNIPEKQMPVSKRLIAVKNATS